MKTTIQLVHVVHITHLKSVHLRKPCKINVSKVQVQQVHFSNPVQMHQLRV